MNTEEANRTQLKVAVIGHGKMGKEIEKILHEKGHLVYLVIDSEDDWAASAGILSTADVALEFSMPDRVATNLYRCFDASVPVVCGTTGWYTELQAVREYCLNKNGCLFYAPNFNISVNIFFETNKLLAKLMNTYPEFEVNIEEVHHVTKIDAPSGTAIALANDIIRFFKKKERWSAKKLQESEIEIKSVREENVPGTHIVTYESLQDIIQISHTAKSRRGFALGAVMAAEWVVGRSGIFEMKDMLGIKSI